MPIVDQSHFPTQLYTAQQVRALDRLAIEQHGIAGYDLMCRAAKAAFAQLQARWPQAGRLLIFCGAGNNAGDGYVLARLAQEAGLTVKVIAMRPVTDLTGDALHAAEQWLAVGAISLWAECANDLLNELNERSCLLDTVIVDALLGTGLSREVSDEWAHAIRLINIATNETRNETKNQASNEAMTEQATLGGLALDIPSGLCADTGAVLGVAVQASLTVTFIGAKIGLLTGAGPDYVGELHFADLAVPQAVYQTQAAIIQRLHQQNLPQLLPRRQTAYKNQHGHVLVIGGKRGMSGAARMTAETALRCGAGLVSLAVHPESLPGLNSGRPELMCHAITEPEQLNTLLEQADVIAVGPGLGQDAWAEAVFKKLQRDDFTAAEKAWVLDADALNWLARQSQQARQQRPNWVLTPHPGEAARLLASSVVQVERDRPAAVAQLQQQYGGTVVLKGAGSLLASSTEGEAPATSLCSAGNPGMAVGGMGDVLTGVVAALLAQGLIESEAAKLAVYIHASAADSCAERHGMRGLLPMDLLPDLRRMLNQDAY